MRRLLVAAVVSAVASTSMVYGGTGFETTPCGTPAQMPGGSGVTLEVGAGKPFATIQSAVDAADSYDTILVHPGVYKEQVEVSDPAVTGLRIRGTDRNAVII